MRFDLRQEFLTFDVCYESVLQLRSQRRVFLHLFLRICNFCREKDPTLRSSNNLYQNHILILNPIRKGKWRKPPNPDSAADAQSRRKNKKCEGENDDTVWHRYATKYYINVILSVLTQPALKSITNRASVIPAPLNYVTFSSLSPPLEVTEKWRLPRGKIKQRFVIIIIDISPLADSAISRKLVLENSPGWLRRTSATTTLKRYTYILPIPPIPGNFCRVLPELTAVWKKAWP